MTMDQSKIELVEAAGYGPPGGPPPGGGYGGPPPPPGGGGYGPPSGGGGYGPPAGPPPGGYGPPPGGYGPPGGGFGPPPGMGMGGGMMGGQKFHGLAITSMILGIVSIFPGCCCGQWNYLLPATAITLGIIGMLKIKGNPQMFKGGGMAIAGIVCAAVGVMWAIFCAISTLDDTWRSQYGGGY